MNDFISLTCPSCGGKLNIEKNTPTYTCEFCGQTHKLREQDIEYFGRCPICHRNDRVEKLTAILNKQDHVSMKFRPPENLKQVYYYRLLDSNKADKHLEWIALEEKQESVYKKRGNLFGIGSAVALTTSLILIIQMVNSNGQGVFAGILGFLLFVGSIALFVFGVINWLKGKQDQKKYQTELHRQRTLQTQKLMMRYDKIYYCQRDDLLFIPGEEESAPGSNYEEYLSKVLEKST
ncbi:MAG TPA: hypothetical protein PLH64_02355 [Anaerolineaceae bacterium]|nr:hypothetical protein [Anaerolineaceae bacterium]